MRLFIDIPIVPLAPRVMYVDDIPDVADMAALLLGMIGFEVRVAYRGPAALVLAATFQPHVCFLDLNMPGMEGDELAVKLRVQAGERPLVLAAVTAMSGPLTTDRLTRAGFHFHLLKPGDLESMLSVLRGG